MKPALQRQAVTELLSAGESELSGQLVHSEAPADRDRTPMSAPAPICAYARTLLVHIELESERVRERESERERASEAITSLGTFSYEYICMHYRC